MQMQPPIYENFKPGDQAYQVYLRMQSQIEELTVLDSQSLVMKANPNSRNLKDQKEKKLSFTRIFSRITNQALFKEIYPPVIESLLKGINHTSILVGDGTSTFIGTIRDPGIVVYILQELFNQIEDGQLEDNVTIKLSVFEHHPNRGFRDLLVDTQWECIPVQAPQDQKLLGIPEIIIDNFLLAMKIFRIALTNIQDLLQSLETQQFYDRCNGTTIVVEIKAEVAPNQDVREGVNVSRLRLVKMLSVDDQPLVVATTNLFKVLAEVSLRNRRISFVSFKSHPVLEYLRDTLTQNSRICIIGCIDQNYNDILKLCNFASQINGSYRTFQFSIFQWNSSLKELTQNQREGMGLIHKEFQLVDSEKMLRGTIIFKILNEFINYLNRFIEILDYGSELNHSLNCIYSQQLSSHCSKYSNSIHTEDVKEFYLAKVQVYAIEEIIYIQHQQSSMLRQSLSEIHQKHTELQSLRQAMVSYIKRINAVQYPLLTIFDLQRLNNIGQLQNKLIKLFLSQYHQNIFNTNDARTALIYIFQDINSIIDSYLDVVYDKPIEQDIVEAAEVTSEKSNDTPIVVISPIPQQVAVQQDIIEQLFYNKNTRDYINPDQVFQTQLITNKIDKPQQLSEVHLRQPFNFFDEIKKRQRKNKSDININPNQIKNMVREWQDKRFNNQNIIQRHEAHTGIHVLKQSFQSPEYQLVRTQLRYKNGPDNRSTTQLDTDPQKTFNIQPSSTGGQLFRLPRLNLDEKQSRRFFIQ